MCECDRPWIRQKLVWELIMTGDSEGAMYYFTNKEQSFGFFFNKAVF